MIKTAFHINLNTIKHNEGFTGICFFHNSLITHSIINQIVFRYQDVYFLFFISIISDNKTAHKIVYNLINEHIFPINVC